MSEEFSVFWNRIFSFCCCVSSLCFFLPSAVFLISVFSSSSIANEVEDYAVVEDVRHISAADYTRIIIALSKEVQLNVFPTEADPSRGLPIRLVVDFLKTRRGTAIPAAMTIRDGLLKQVRTGQFSATTARVVLDIESVEKYNSFLLHNPFRLVIDVQGGKGRKERERKPPLQKPPLTEMEKSAPLLSPPPPSTFIVMLDPGHGGKDPGAIGEGRVAEKDVVLAISKRVGRKLAARLPVKVLYTRSDDIFIPLEERIARANAAQADLFVSIHANASTNPDLQGVETYYLNNTNDRATIRLASLENGIRPGGNSRGDSLSFLLSDLIQSGKEEDSIALAHSLQEAITTKARETYPSVRNLGVKKGPFYVLVGAHMPCVLVETAFVTHRLEGKYLARAEYQEALAEGLFLGIARFLRTGRAEKNL